ILWLMLLVLAGILTAAMVIQFADREIPCPLCLLERVAMFGCCFGLIQQLRSDGSQRGAGIGLVFSVLLLVISARQTLLDLFPRPGHAYVGGAVFGVHMPVWSVFIAVALLLGFALRLAIFGGPRAAPETEGSTLRRLTYGLSLYVIVICGINCLAVLVRVGRMSHVRLRASALDRRFKRAPGGPETLPGRAACKGLPLRPAEIRCSQHPPVAPSLGAEDYRESELYNAGSAFARARGGMASRRRRPTSPEGETNGSIVDLCEVNLHLDLVAEPVTL
ncbi:MAG: disulfide bond formation protein B, partial [Roseiarcus sp.]|uniref:disulfide bond formation protein B n=1 Tax=Roseiarcus sp. TaxID=1969460 RepID=UPI003BAE4AF4